MNNVKLVSVLTPAYNSERFIHRLLDSILIQDYPRIEMIVVDDGSTDETKPVVISYIAKFEQKGYSLQYIFQENQGQSAAINKGLKFVKGDYLVWPDSDDFYACTNAISRMVAVLEASSADVSIVRTLFKNVDEHSLKEIYSVPITADLDRTDLFADCIRGEHGFWYQPGDYMCKMEVLDWVIPNREIYYEKEAGQNWQILLPLLYSHKCVTIKEYLYKVTKRSNSHSSTRQSIDYNTAIKREKSYGNSIIETLKRMPLLTAEDREKWLRIKRIDANVCYLNVAIAHQQKGEAKNFYRILKNLGYRAPHSMFFSVYFCDSILYKIVNCIKYRTKKIIK